jgi:ribosomal protein L37AE/L43A
MAQQENMSLPDFQKKFGVDEARGEHLFKIRRPEGPVCPKCGKNEFYTIRKRNIYECKGCGHQVSLTAGTIMRGSRTPLHKRFLAVYLAGHDKRGVFALR